MLVSLALCVRQGRNQHLLQPTEIPGTLESHLTLNFLQEKPQFCTFFKLHRVFKPQECAFPLNSPKLPGYSYSFSTPCETRHTDTLQGCHWKARDIRCWSTSFLLHHAGVTISRHWAVPAYGEGSCSKSQIVLIHFSAGDVSFFLI